MSSYRVTLLTILTLFCNVAAADQLYTFGIVPEVSASKTAKDWTPIIKYLEERTGKKFRFATTPSVPIFSQRLDVEKYDFAYVSPTDYVKYQHKARYSVIARARNFKLKGIVVVRKDSPIEKLDELNEKELAVPAHSFAADLLARAALHDHGIAVKVLPLATPDAVYRAVAQGRSTAGGGILQTLATSPSEFSEQLRVVWTSEGYTPNAFVAHARVPKDIVQAVQEALIDMHQDPMTKKYLKTIAPEGLDYGRDLDWDDTRKLDI